MSFEGYSGDEGLSTPRLATPALEDDQANEPNMFEGDAGQQFQEISKPRPGRPGRPAAYSGRGRPPKQDNPEELADAVAAAGVNLRAEEEAMNGGMGLGVSKMRGNGNQFLRPQQLAWFMTRTMEQQGMPAMEFDVELINLISAACENYMSAIVSDSVVMSRHRRVGVRTKKKAMQNSKSEVSKALKEIAVKQKLHEEKRVKRRVVLGLEEDKKDEQKEEQTQTNMTASLMMSGSTKKRYSWMQTASSNSALSSRGDNGIRYREAREEPGIVMRDLLSAIDGRRRGVISAKVKGYAKLHD